MRASQGGECYLSIVRFSISRADLAEQGPRPICDLGPTERSGPTISTDRDVPLGPVAASSSTSGRWVDVRPDDSTQQGLTEQYRALQHGLRTQLNNIVSFAALLLYDAERTGDRPFADELKLIENEGRSSLAFVARVSAGDGGESHLAAAKTLVESIRHRVWKLQASPAAADPQVAADLQRIGGSAQRLAVLLRTVSTESP
jgi:hypothetical protein